MQDPRAQTAQDARRFIRSDFEINLTWQFAWGPLPQCSKCPIHPADVWKVTRALKVWIHFKWFSGYLPVFQAAKECPASGTRRLNISSVCQERNVATASVQSFGWTELFHLFWMPTDWNQTVRPMCCKNDNHNHGRCAQEPVSQGKPYQQKHRVNKLQHWQGCFNAEISRRLPSFQLLTSSLLRSSLCTSPSWQSVCDAKFARHYLFSDMNAPDTKSIVYN